MEEIVHSCHLIVLITIQALSCIVFLEAVAFEISKKRGFNRNLILTNYQSLALTDGLISLVPGVLLDLICGQSLVRICFENLIDEVDTLW